jgi:hypothetical protein
LFAVPLIALIFISDLPLRQGDLIDIFFRAPIRWSVWSILYSPLPLIAFVGVLLGIIGLFHDARAVQNDGSIAEDARQTRASRKAVLYLPFLLAMWIVIALVFVGWIPEVV